MFFCACDKKHSYVIVKPFLGQRKPYHKAKKKEVSSVLEPIDINPITDPGGVNVGAELTGHKFSKGNPLQQE